MLAELVAFYISQASLANVYMNLSAFSINVKKTQIGEIKAAELLFSWRSEL